MKTIRQHTNGFAHILILILVLFFALGGVMYFVVMGSKNSVSDSIQSLYAKPSPTVSVTQKGLEEELNELETQDADPVVDFTNVDEDIESL